MSDVAFAFFACCVLAGFLFLFDYLVAVVLDGFFDGG